MIACDGGVVGGELGTVDEDGFTGGLIAGGKWEAVDGGTAVVEAGKNETAGNEPERGSGEDTGVEGDASLSEVGQNAGFVVRLGGRAAGDDPQIVFHVRDIRAECAAEEDAVVGGPLRVVGVVEVGGDGGGFAVMAPRGDTAFEDFVERTLFAFLPIEDELAVGREARGAGAGDDEQFFASGGGLLINGTAVAGGAIGDPAAVGADVEIEGVGAGRS